MAPIMAKTMVRVSPDDFSALYVAAGYWNRAASERIVDGTELAAGCRVGHGLRPWRGRRWIETGMAVI